MTRLKACVAFLHKEGKQDHYEKDSRDMIIKPCDETMNMTARERVRRNKSKWTDVEVRPPLLLPSISLEPDICPSQPTVSTIQVHTKEGTCDTSSYDTTLIPTTAVVAITDHSVDRNGGTESNEPEERSIATAPMRSDGDTAGGVERNEEEVCTGEATKVDEESSPPSTAPPATTAGLLRGIRVSRPREKSLVLVGYELAETFLRRNTNTWFELGALREGMSEMKGHKINTTNSRLRFYVSSSTRWKRMKKNNALETGPYSGMIYKQDVLDIPGKRRKVIHSVCFNE